MAVEAHRSRSHETLAAKLRALPEAEFGKTMKFFVGPKQMGDVREGDVFWNFLMDNVHHRGQLSVYMRKSAIDLWPVWR